MKKITLLFIFSIFCFVSKAQVLSESFNSSTLPSGWTQEYESGTKDWNAVTSNGSGNIQPRNGSHMAEFRTTVSGDITKLVTPSLDLTTLIAPQLKFYYANENWFGDIDELRVYYKTSSEGEWTQLGVDYEDENIEWAEVILSLPNPSNDYYIAFEGTSEWARGINIDDVTVGEAPTCTVAIVASSNVVDDCGNSQFSVNVDITVVGDATHITNGTDTWAISGAGVVTVGPFAAGSSQTLTIVHSDTDCNFSLGNLTFVCPPTNTTCAEATSISCGETINGTSVGSTGTSEDIGCNMGVNGVWYSFEGTGGDITVTTNASFDHRLGISRGACGSFTNIVCNDEFYGEETHTIPLTTLGETYYVYIAHYGSGNTTTGTHSITITCAAPPDCTAATVASSTRVNDCANNQFNVEVDITNVGDAIHISNGTTTWPVSGTGVVTVGPFAVGGGAQTLTLVHSDTVCNVALGTFNLTACPPVNDLFANAIAINCGDTVYGTTIGATHDEADAPSVATQEPDTSADNDSPWVWYSFTGTVAGDEITLSTCGVDFTDFDTEIFVYTGTSGNLTLIDDGYDECGGSSANWAAETTFTSDGTSTYYIAIGGYDVDDIGEFRLVVSCESLSVENPSLNQSFTYFPNPVNNTLQLNAQSNIQNVSIFNMLGQEVLRTAPNNVNSTVDMSAMQTGAYFVKVTINDKTETVRVIKQ